jgi:hypothetical protein
MLASELAKLKHLFNLVIDYMDSITKDPKVSLADRLNSERIKVDAIGKLQDVIEASITSPDPSTALDKIAEQSSGCCSRLRCGNQ